jgi:prepilin-type N-terminal cleavage/methylation domain-containing protein
MKKNAFTLLELVFVVVVIGILAVALIPRFERDNVGEAAYQLVRHIRLAQHHAMVEDMFDSSDPSWAEKMWRVRFIKSGDKGCYVVFADRNKLGNANDDEIAIDTLTKKPIYANSTCSENSDHDSDALLWKQFGVTNVQLTQGCSARKHIAFDYFGRPLQIVSSNPVYIDQDCMIEIETEDGHSAAITVVKETGFVKVTKIDSTSL